MQFCGRQCDDNKSIPNWLRHTNKFNKAIFIKSLFDDEGSIRLYKKNGSKHIKIGMSNFNIISFVKYVLKVEFDIDTSLKFIKKKKITYKNMYYLYFYSNSNLKRFYESIGFNHPEKQNKLIQNLNSIKLKVIAGSIKS